MTKLSEFTENELKMIAAKAYYNKVFFIDRTLGLEGRFHEMFEGHDSLFFSDDDPSVWATSVTLFGCLDFVDYFGNEELIPDADQFESIEVGNAMSVILSEILYGVACTATNRATKLYQKKTGCSDDEAFEFNEELMEMGAEEK